MDTSRSHVSGSTPGLDLRVLLTSGVRGGPRVDTASQHTRSPASNQTLPGTWSADEMFFRVHFAFSNFYSEPVFLHSDNDQYINDIDDR